jgi:two-component system response regulator AtoC
MPSPFVFGSHERMKDLERRSGCIARSRLPVLIEGASGTGKEAFAELLHEVSGIGGRFTRIVCRKPVPAVNPERLMVSGAARLSTLDLTTPGTVFLKNVHLLSPAEQEQLLAALEQMADSDHGTDEGAERARLVSSATELLDPFGSRCEINPALYHRLSVYRISLPSLPERREDIPELFAHMVGRASNGHGAPPPATSHLLEALLAYDWPGNLRELQNFARRYVVTGHAEEIIAELESSPHRTSLTPQAQHDSRSLKEQVRGVSQKLESEIILRTLERHHWNRRRAAQTLQISYRSLLYKMKSCQLRVESQATPGGK